MYHLIMVKLVPDMDNALLRPFALNIENKYYSQTSY